jgi:hypothetical protein
MHCIIDGNNSVREVEVLFKTVSLVLDTTPLNSVQPMLESKKQTTNKQLQYKNNKVLNFNVALKFNRVPMGHNLSSFRVKSPLIIESATSADCSIDNLPIKACEGGGAESPFPRGIMGLISNKVSDLCSARQTNCVIKIQGSNPDN